MQASSDVALHTTKNGTNGYTTASEIVFNAIDYYSRTPSDTEMKEIAELTYTQDFINEIVEILLAGLVNPSFDCGQISTCLTVLNYCLKEGSENVAIYFCKNINAIKHLREFRYIDESGKDHGANVRQKAIDVCNLLQYESLLHVVRRAHGPAQNRVIHVNGEDDVDAYDISTTFINGSIPSTLDLNSKSEEAGILESSTDKKKELEMPSESEFNIRLRRSLEPAFRRDTRLQDLGHQLSMLLMLCRLLVNAVLRDKEKYRTLLAYRGEDAQRVLNLLQLLLDYSPLVAKTKHSLLIALHRLSRNSMLYPQCFSLKDFSATQKESVVAAGHFGKIFKGKLRGQAVCIKIVTLYRHSHVESLLKACSKEVILWRHLSHPNLLPFYGLYYLQKFPHQICLVSPWMENDNIMEYLTHNPDVSRFLLVHDIVAGILHLHENDIVHGGLKGTNILVTSSGRACLADVGLSAVADANKWISAPIRGMANVDGSIRWQAPELIYPKDVKSTSTKASDIYAFASVCYEIFTGMVPFYDIARAVEVELYVLKGMQPVFPASSLRVKNKLTDNIWQLMKESWNTDPVGRPTIQAISRRLSMDGLRVVDDRSDNGKEALPSTAFRKSMHSPADHFSYEDLQDISTWLPDL